MSQRKSANITAGTPAAGISIDGRTYPYRQTMGAMLRFRRLTGREATEIDGKSVTDMITFVYCCTASACSADGVDFDYSLDEFADRITTDDINRLLPPRPQDAPAPPKAQAPD